MKQLHLIKLDKLAQHLTDAKSQKESPVFQPSAIDFFGSAWFVGRGKIVDMLMATRNPARKPPGMYNKPRWNPGIFPTFPSTGEWKPDFWWTNRISGCNHHQ